MTDVLLSDLISNAISGATGYTGSAGVTGYTGSQGAIGYTGSAGNKNVDGGNATSTYLPTQLLNGGSANG